ncbi:PREDICTED: ester hydrolase C11orf54 homolog [Amphimedon queenslandica]|uniref:DUF1907 domain-containing protein n=1 Tax=Amphimedon queenslandica TaxID=400682 RepID=A0A1X7V9X8_AMPQE|nr:PREDICTED: ester hydrolase C11orf54 homolog [Amphimedon queenslandica]|eukprot:XP_003385232.1 PREDICTED: ester hydrolase C11orf54 homolog [Amphimedon queenslandica]
MSSSSFPVEKRQLHTPDLSHVAQVIESGLKENFKEASVNVVDCPDLTSSPWQLAAPGLGGAPRLLDVGGVPYLMPLIQREKVYDLAQVASLAGLPNGFILGAGAGSYRVAGVNCEMMANIKFSDPDSGAPHNIGSYSAKVSTEDGSAIIEKFPYTEAGPLANLLLCEGTPGAPVLEIKARKRVGEENFVTCMRKSLAAYFGEGPVGLGGVFMIKKGKAKLHIMPDFSQTPLTTNEGVNKWLQFYNMSSPLTCLSVFISCDPGLDLRVEHTHCFSSHGDGGHYHYDVTPQEVEYHGYYVIAEEIVRIDRPIKTHQIGRD